MFYYHHRAENAVNNAVDNVTDAVSDAAEAVGDALNIPCRVSPDARDCVVLGCAKALSDPAGMRHLLANG